MSCPGAGFRDSVERVARDHLQRRRRRRSTRRSPRSRCSTSRWCSPAHHGRDEREQQRHRCEPERAVDELERTRGRAPPRPAGRRRPRPRSAGRGPSDVTARLYPGARARRGRRRACPCGPPRRGRGPVGRAPRTPHRVLARARRPAPGSLHRVPDARSRDRRSGSSGSASRRPVPKPGPTSPEVYDSRARSDLDFGRSVESGAWRPPTTDDALRPARDRRADRGPFGLRPRGRRLLRADRVEPGPHSRRPPLLPVRAAERPAAAAREAAQLPASDWLEQDSLVACPDPDERVIMRIERIARRTMATGDLT